MNDQIKKLTNNSIPDDILDVSFERLVITNDPEKVSISDFIKIAKEVGFIEKEPDIEMLLNTNILNDVLKQSGQSEIK